MSTIVGRDSRLVRDIPNSIKILEYRARQTRWWKRGWRDKAILSQTDLCVIVEERAKSGPIPLTEPIYAEFYNGK